LAHFRQFGCSRICDEFINFVLPPEGESVPMIGLTTERRRPVIMQANRPGQAHQARTLKGPVPSAFEAFYRQHLRFCTGRRVGSVELRGRYLDWASANAAGEMSFVSLRRAMENIGHRQRRSNGIYYADVAFAETAADQADNYPAPPPIQPSEAAVLLRTVDHVAGELSAIRATLARFAEAAA
jgi:hypothetical protein